MDGKIILLITKLRVPANRPNLVSRPRLIQKLNQGVQPPVKEHLEQQWTEWLGNFTVVDTPQNETILTGSVSDQAALFGLLSKLRDLGVTLISVSFGELASNEC